MVTKAATRRFFFGGTALFAVAFAALTIHTHTTIAERTHEAGLTDAVRRGLAVWAAHNCENCHTLLGEGAYFAPDLTRVVQQRGRPYLAAFLVDPARFYSEERDGRLMPTLGLSAQQIDDVLAFLEWVGGIDTNGWPPRPILVSGVSERGLPGVEASLAAATAAERGRALFHGEAACATCHSLAPGTPLVGPSLDAVATRASARIADPSYHGGADSAQGYLRESILRPSAFVAPGGTFATPAGESLMPAHYEAQLGPERIDDLVAYLMTLGEGAR